jgi:hypothetical protein
MDVRPSPVWLHQETGAGMALSSDAVGDAAGAGLTAG